MINIPAVTSLPAVMPETGRSNTTPVRMPVDSRVRMPIPDEQVLQGCLRKPQQPMRYVLPPLISTLSGGRDMPDRIGAGQALMDSLVKKMNHNLPLTRTLMNGSTLDADEKFLYTATALTPLLSTDHRIAPAAVSNTAADNAAAALARWSKSSDIGSEVLKLFLGALIAMRESMRESRQLALTLYSRHADVAVAELREQGKANWAKDIAGAVGMMVSGAVQIGMVAAPLIHNAYTKRSAVNAAKTDPLATKSTAAETAGKTPESAAGGRATSAKPQEIHREAGIESRADVGELELTAGVKDNKVKADAGADPTVTPPVAANARKYGKIKKSDQQLNTESQRLQTCALVAHAVGEIIQGISATVGAHYGWVAAEHGANHFIENTATQKQIFQRDKWSTESDVLTRTMEQVLSTISDLQTRQSDSLGKLIGRA